MRDERGLSLLEMLLAGTFFSLVALLSFLLLSRSVGLWTHVVEAESAGLELSKASQALRQDLLLANLGECRRTEVPANLPGGGKDGYALWFLSAIDPDSGELIRKPDGTPFWQKNILYYLVVPSGHLDFCGIDCAGGIGPDGFDDRCPHKILVRKVIDSGVPTGPATDPETTQEELLTDVSDYLTRPQGYSVASMASEAGVVRVEPVAVRLLWFSVKVSDPEEPHAVQTDLRAVAIDDARKHLVIGKDALAEGRFTVNRFFSVEPMN